MSTFHDDGCHGADHGSEVISEAHRRKQTADTCEHDVDEQNAAHSKQQLTAVLLTTHEKISIALHWYDLRKDEALWSIGFGTKIREAEEDLLRSKRSGSSSEQWFRINNVHLLNKAEIEMRLSKLQYRTLAGANVRMTISKECCEIASRTFRIKFS